MDPITVLKRILPIIAEQVGGLPGGGLPGGGDMPSFNSRADGPSGGKGRGTSPGGKAFDPGPNKELEPHKESIEDAADISGLDPNLIGAQVWAESRGDPTTKTDNEDGNEDTGVMQISQERWEGEIAPTLDDETRQKIMDKTGKRPEELDMTDPKEGMIGGSIEMKKKLDDCDGDLEEALGYYQSGNPGGNPTYSKNVLQYMDELENGQKLSEDPFGSP